MNNRKSLAIAVTAISLGTAGMLTTPTTTQASSWHKGTPTALRGHWRTKMTKVKYASKYVWNYTYINVLKSGINGAWGFHLDNMGINNTKYKSLGHGRYKIIGFGIGGKQTWYMNKISAKKIRLRFSYATSHKYTTYYKYSGKHSKYTFYPYP